MNSFSLIKKILRKPYVVISFLAIFILAGIVGYKKTHRNLFPNSNYPEIAVVVVEPGASAKTIASNVAVPIEEELYTLDLLRRAYSTTIDEVTVIRAEFDYKKNINDAAIEVKNAVDKIKSKLPNDIKEPQIIKITETTAPVLVVSLNPKGNISLEDIRDLAQSELKHRLLKLEGVANVDVFGGYEKELQIVIDKNKLDKYHLSILSVIAIIEKNDKDSAIGFISNEDSRYLIKSNSKQNDIQKLKNLYITKDIRLKDVADIYFSHYENSALYFGNGKPSIALSIQRSQSADVISTIEKIEKELKILERLYPNISFEISDTQKETIEQSTTNMFESLRDAIVMSTIVVFLFLASFRQILVVLVTIPLVYASTIALMYLVGIEFNVVTLTAIILALGLLLDDTVVVMENIERHYKELGKDIKDAVFDGTKEIMFADFSGTITTMIALSPMLFVGGYPETVFKPLVGTLLLALIASYFISIIAVPLLSLYILAIKNKILLKIEDIFHKVIFKANDYIQNFFANIVKAIISSKIKATFAFVVLIALFISSVKLVMPTVGQELMPPMDTGAVNLDVTLNSNLPVEKTKETLIQINKILSQSGKLLRSSASVGSEAGVLSIGSGSDISHIKIVATYVNRYERDESIWDIAKKIRQKLSKIEAIKEYVVSPYGATALSSIRGNVDTKLSSNDLDKLLLASKEVQKALAQTKGIVSVATTWDKDKIVYDLKIDDKKALTYGLNKDDIIKQVSLFLRGKFVSNFEKIGSVDYNIRVWVKKDQINSKQDILDLLLQTKKGKIPLKEIAVIKTYYEPSLITREGLEYTIEVYGNREKMAISHIINDYNKHLKNISLPSGVELEEIGDMKQFKSSASRMIGAIIAAVVLIFFTLVIMFSNIKISLMILFSIPLTIIGASWNMLILGYHTSMPAMMGFMLLSGVIVNNAILLIHFAMDKMKEGVNKIDAMIESIKIRTRPVLMTAFAVSVGMLPVALGSAIGLERLAPLGAVAIGGLIIGTFMTLVFIPVVFIWSVKDLDIE